MTLSLKITLDWRVLSLLPAASAYVEPVTGGEHRPAVQLLPAAVCYRQGVADGKFNRWACFLPVVCTIPRANGSFFPFIVVSRNRWTKRTTHKCIEELQWVFVKERERREGEGGGWGVGVFVRCLSFWTHFMDFCSFIFKFGLIFFCWSKNGLFIYLKDTQNFNVD